MNTLFMLLQPHLISMRDCWFEIVYGITVFIYNVHPLQLMEKREINFNISRQIKDNTTKITQTRILSRFYELSSL